MRIIDGGKKKPKTKKLRKNKSRYDWEAIAVDVRGRSPTLRAISRKHKIDYGYMMRGCKKRGIKRDLADQVRKEVENQLVIRRAKKVTTPKEVVTKGETEDPTNKEELTDKQIIEMAAFAELEFIDNWHETFRKTLNIVVNLKAQILADDSKEIVVGNKLIAVGYSPGERSSMLNAITQAETRIFESMRKNYGIGADNDRSRDSEFGGLNDSELDREIGKLEANKKAERA